MNLQLLWQRVPAPLRRRPVLLGAAAALLVLAVSWLAWPRSRTVASACYDARRGDFTVSVVEGGTLGAVNEIIVRSEVEGTARIIRLVPEGSYVKKGDLLVELDSAQAQDQVNVQEIAFEKAKFALEQARAAMDILKSTTNSDFLAAALKVKFAKLDRDKYDQGQRLVDLVDASNKVIQAEAQLSVNLDTFINSTNLAAKGYETKQKADGDRLAVLNNRNSLVVATNGLWILKRFDIPKQRDKFDSDVMQAEQELARVVSQNERKIAQSLADLSAQSNTLILNEEKLNRDKKNLDATKIFAPQDGLVVYQMSESRFSSESLIEGGAIVRNRQELIKLPDLSRMKVTIKVHESHVNLVRPGQPAFVVLDSAPDTRIRAVVEKVAPLPDGQSRWGNPNLKVYTTEVYLTDPLPSVKPGVSAKVEIVVTNIADVLSVPIQAVTTLKGKPVVYVGTGQASQARPVEVGLFNTKFIEITKGLTEGDRVLLSPPFDTSEKDLNGGILAEGEARGLTNTPVRERTESAPPGAGSAGSADLRGSGDLPGGNAVRTGEGREGRRSGRPGMPNREEMLKRFDKNGDGKLDETELAAMRASFPGRPGGQGGPGGSQPPGRGSDPGLTNAPASGRNQ